MYGTEHQTQWLRIEDLRRSAAAERLARKTRRERRLRPAAEENERRVRRQRARWAEAA